MYVIHMLVRTCVRCPVTRPYIIIYLLYIIISPRFSGIPINLVRRPPENDRKQPSLGGRCGNISTFVAETYLNASFLSKIIKKKGVLPFENRVLIAAVKFFRKTTVTFLRITRIRASSRWRA